MGTFCISSSCDFLLNSKCVFYEGSALPYTGIVTNDSVQTALQKIEAAIAAGGGGGGSAVWGDITGIISNQTDLINYLSGNYTPLSRILTINGQSFDLSQNRSWDIGTVTDVTATAPLASSGGNTPDISLTGIVSVANGGTGAGTFPTGRLLIADDTSPFITDADLTWSTATNTLNARRVVTTSTSTSAGVNVGSTGIIPSGAVNGDLWYYSTQSTLMAYVNGVPRGIITDTGTQVLHSKIFETSVTFNVNPTINDGRKFTFNPDGTNAGINVGAHPVDPTTLVNGDLWYDSTNNLLRARINGTSVSLISSSTLTFGTSGQIPYTNSGGNGFSYDADLSYVQATNRFYAGSNFTVTGSGIIDNITLLGTGHVISGGTAQMRWNYIAGELNTMTASGVGNIANSSIFGGNSNNITATGFTIFNGFILGGAFNNITATIEQTNSQLIFGRFNDNNQSYAVALGYRARATGIGSLAFGTTPGTNGTSNEPTIEKITAAGRHAINISANSSSQTVGHGAYADYSVILGGQDHDIPSTSSHSVILGGNAIKARASDPNQVYVPNLNIVNTPDTDDALTGILSWDPTSKKVKLRTASSLGGGWPLSGNGVLTSNVFIYPDVTDTRELTIGSDETAVNVLSEFRMNSNNQLTLETFGPEGNISLVGNHGGIELYTASRSGTDDSGHIQLETGEVEDGISGNITISTGSVTGIGTRGDIHISAAPGNITMGAGNLQVNSTSVNFNSDNQAYASPGGEGITIDDTDGIVLHSNGFSKGASYAGDYSAANASNPRWIPDKAYVDSVIGGGGWAVTGATTLTGAATVNGAVDLTFGQSGAGRITNFNVRTDNISLLSFNGSATVGRAANSNITISVDTVAITAGIGGPSLTLDNTTGLVDITSGIFSISSTPANDDTLTDILVRDSVTGDIKTRSAASIAGITNTAVNNELAKSNGTNLVPSGIFVSTNGNLDLGSVSISGSRVIRALSSTANASITIQPQGNGITTVMGPNSGPGFTYAPSGVGTNFQIGRNLLTFGSAVSPSTYVINTVASDGINVSHLTIQTGNSIGAVQSGNLTLITGSQNQNVTTGNVIISSGDNTNSDVSSSANSGNIFITTGSVASADVSALEGSVGFFTTSSGIFGGGEKVIFIGNAATPSTSAPTNGIIFHSKDSSVGSANATLALYLEQAVETIGTFTATDKIRIWINNVEYYIQLEAV